MPVIAVLALAGMSSSFMMTLVIPIQPELPRLIGASADDTTWLITATVLTSAVVTPISGRLGDQFGKRRVIIALAGTMIAGSLVGAFSGQLVPLVIARALQGTSIPIVPLGIATLRDIVHPDRLGGAIALVSATLGIGASLGLPIGAVLSEYIEWHAIFWFGVALGVVVLVLVIVVVPPSVLRTPGRFDLPGAIGLAIGLASVLLAVSKGNEWGWTSVPVLALLIGGACWLVLWGAFELRRRGPLVDLRVVARRPVLFTNLASVFMGFSLFGSNVALPQLLELPDTTGVGLGQPLIVASLALTPSGVVMMLLSPVSAILIRRFGARILLISGALTIVVAYAVALAGLAQVWQIMFVSTVIGVGIGLGYAAMPTLIMQSVPSNETAAANSLNTLARSIGTACASAVVGVVLAGFATPVGELSIPTLEAFRLTFLLGGVAALLSAAMAFLTPRRRRRYPEHAALPDLPGLSG
jgi:MFS family permease